MVLVGNYQFPIGKTPRCWEVNQTREAEITRSDPLRFTRGRMGKK